MVTNAPPPGPAPGLAVESSARISTAPARSELRPDKPSGKTSDKPSDKARKLPSGSGSDLPVLSGIGWEQKPDGSIEAWHVPHGVTKRAGKTYLGRVGKRQLAAWSAAPDMDAVVAEWIASKRREKGIEL